MEPSALIGAWESAARDLGIEIVAPCVVTLASGARLEAVLLVPDFGASRGMLISTTEEAFRPLGDEIVAERYGYSVFLMELSYQRDDFIDILNDWGWTGPEARRPAWST